MLQVIKDSRLFAIVGVFLFVDTVVLAIWMLLFPLHSAEIELPEKVRHLYVKKQPKQQLSKTLMCSSIVYLSKNSKQAGSV